MGLIGVLLDTPTTVPLRIVGLSLRKADSAIFLLPLGASYELWARQVCQKWQGTPYGSGGAGTGPQELLVNLERMDCMTATENFLALHLTRKTSQRSAATFLGKLLQVRYQASPPCRWEDRYHYLTHAFVSWELHGWGTWLPLGEKDTRSVSYITQHPEQYKGFRDWKELRRIETALSRRPRYYIPTKDLHSWLSLLRNGDIIAFVASKEGLDVSHVGIFFWEGERPTFAHASQTQKKWVFGEDLCAYLDRRGEKVKGITVFRPFP
ncbi:MAG: DUF1460 domain-containing protein [Bacteroidia bacterium]|nr:DUF1460 domain-containing protein [Bacteroidia bacterium]